MTKGIPIPCVRLPDPNRRIMTIKRGVIGTLVGLVRLVELLPAAIHLHAGNAPAGGAYGTDPGVGSFLHKHCKRPDHPSRSSRSSTLSVTFGIGEALSLEPIGWSI
jgi:hypothetical protein